MSVHRLKIESDSVAAVQVSPKWNGEIEHERDSDGVYFTIKAGSDFNFASSEYTTLKNVPDCEEIDIWLEELCGEDWIERWRGRFTTYDVKFDENNCRASVAPKTVGEYDCFLAAWEKDHIVSGASSIVTAVPFGGVYEAGFGCCYECIPTGDPIPTDPVCAVPSGYCFDKNYIEYEHDGPLCDYSATSCFHRIVGIGTTVDPPPYSTGWAYLSGNDWWRCPDGTELDLGVFDEGRIFNDIVEYLVLQTGCGLTVKSHFLGINADHDAPPSNIAYDFATANYQAIQVHQKSDIKRPDATNPAQTFVWRMSMKKLLADMAAMWQVYWKIDGTDLIIEHISYFEAATGIDMTEKNIKLLYGKQEGGAPNEETFKWADGEATFSEAHAGFPISYGSCGDGIKEHKLNYFSNDVFYIRSVENQEEIADAGFCLICTEDIDGQQTIIDNNAALGFVAIHENLFRHNRFFMEGVMNDAPETFLSIRKTRKLEPFSVSLCCDDGFSPEDSIDTLAGTSIVQKATVNYFSGTDSNRVTIEANI